MPGNCSSGSNSPSLSSVLRQYRFQKKASPTSASSVSKDNSSQPKPEESIDKSTLPSPKGPESPPPSRVLIVPETPESQRPISKSSESDVSQEFPSSTSINKSLCGSSQEKESTKCDSSLTDTSQNSSKPESQSSQTDTSQETLLSIQNGHCVNPRSSQSQAGISRITNCRKSYTDYRKRSCIRQSITTSTELELTSSQHRQLMDEYDIFSDKERSLRNLLEMYPGSDIMEVQDILVSCDWDLKSAVKIVQKRPLTKGKKRCHDNPVLTEEIACNRRKGVVYDSDSTDSESQILNNSSKTEQPEIKKKRCRIVISDDSDKEDGPEKGCTKNDSFTKVSKSRKKIQKHSSGEDSSRRFKNEKVKGPSIRNLSNDALGCINDTALKSQSEDNVESAPKLMHNVKECQLTEKSKENFQMSTQKDDSTMNSCTPSNSLKIELNSPSSSASPSSYKNETDFVDKQMSDQTVMNIRRTYSKNIAKKPKNVAEIMKESLAEIQKKASLKVQKESSSETENSGKKYITNERTTENEKTYKRKLASNFRRGSTLHKNETPARTKKRVIKVVSDDEDEGEEYNNECLYDSDASDVDDSLTPVRSSVMTFFQEAKSEELLSVPGCSKKKAEMITQCRPFKGWSDLVQKFSSSKYLSPELLNGAKKVLDMRSAIRKLMNRCKTIADDMQYLVSDLLEETEKGEEHVAVQPELLNPRLSLAQYQMVGLNWLVLMHKQHVNGILADEMGLGKTVQAIAFLAHLSEKGKDEVHLIVVPSSTLDNWKRELEKWCPSLSVLCYHGSQEERRELRMRILNDEVDFNILITTYNMVTSSSEDRGLFKRIEFHYVIFDEAHMLKNMGSQRYQNLMKIRAKRRLLLTGTPLQNNLVELMSLLIFVMPSMFSGKIDQLKQMFSAVSKSEENRSKFEQEQIEHAKHIMKPFLLRRLKKEVLKQLPTKSEEVKLCPLTDAQQEQYSNLVISLLKQVKESQEKDISTSGMGMMMQLRKAANHPLLLRNYYTDSQLKKMAQLMLKEPTHQMADLNLIVEDMQVMSDFELHRLCKMYKSISSFQLKAELIVDSAKFKFLDTLLEELKDKGDRLLLFSQFTMMLDILEEYLSLRDHRYLRLDGTTPVIERQQLIDIYTEDAGILVFLLSTRAGGLGINLTAANVVVLHDIDFNPYNDKQAEDRCHRVGQKREVKVLKLISKNTIEENILQRAKEKLRLERDITAEEEQASEDMDTGSVAKLLRAALSL